MKRWWKNKQPQKQEIIADNKLIDDIVNYIYDHMDSAFIQHELKYTYQAYFEKKFNKELPKKRSTMGTT